jgi:hypothetical protein
MFLGTGTKSNKAKISIITASLTPWYRLIQGENQSHIICLFFYCYAEDILQLSKEIDVIVNLDKDKVVSWLMKEFGLAQSMSVSRHQVIVD